jgi:uncharacterized protein (TIGR03437 family)
VILSWDDLLNPTGTTYNVYRVVGLCNGTLTFSKLASGVTVKTYTDAGVSPGDYCYVVTAAANGLESAYSNTAGAHVMPVTVPQPPLTIATLSPLPNGTVGIPYVWAFGASGGAGDYTWSLLSGPAPPGLSVSANGFISGTPTAPVQSTFSVRVTDSDGQTAAKDFRLTILPMPLIITTTSPLPSAPISTPLTVKFTATGGVPPYTFGVTGSLPPGTLLTNNGTLSGTPVATGTFAFRVAVTDSSNGTPPSGTAFKDFTFTITPPPLTILSVVNGASFQPGMAPNSWITIQGTNLASVTDSWSSSVVHGQLPTILDGVSINVGGTPAYVQYVSPTQINALTPPNTVTGPFQVTVSNPSGTSAPASVISQPAQPAFFEWPGHYAVALHAGDYSPAINGVSTTPAKPGDILILWGTGLGPTNPPAPVGTVVPSTGLYSVTSSVGVTINGVGTTVIGAALAPGFAGLYQVAIQVPQSIGAGDWPIVATVSGVQSPATTLLTVHN